MKGAELSAKLNFTRAAWLAVYGSTFFYLSPSPLTFSLYAFCRARAIYKLACGFEDLAAAMPPINPS